VIRVKNVDRKVVANMARHAASVRLSFCHRFSDLFPTVEGRLGRFPNSVLREEISDSLGFIVINEMAVAGNQTFAVALDHESFKRVHPISPFLEAVQRGSRPIWRNSLFIPVQHIRKGPTSKAESKEFSTKN
jgi:hypothetical protein